MNEADKVIQLQSELDRLVNIRLDLLNMTLYPKTPYIARERKNGRHEIEGKRYSIKQLEEKE